jgi:hypothetical protein
MYVLYVCTVPNVWLHACLPLAVRRSQLISCKVLLRLLRPHPPTKRSIMEGIQRHCRNRKVVFDSRPSAASGPAEHVCTSGVVVIAGVPYGHTQYVAHHLHPTTTWSHSSIRCVKYVPDNLEGKIIVSASVGVGEECPMPATSPFRSALAPSNKLLPHSLTRTRYRVLFRC